MGRDIGIDTLNPISYNKNGLIIENAILADYSLIYIIDDFKSYGTNEKPLIQAHYKVIKAGDKFNPLEGVSTSDKEDGEIKVLENIVNPLKSWTYKVVYSVTDSDGNTVTKEIKVTVI